MESVTGIDELTLKTNFKLEPSYKTFSKIKAELFFEDTSINTVFIQVLQGALGTNELEYSWIMDTKGIVAGSYHLKVEMYEVGSSEEKACQTSCKITINYVPQTRHSRLIKIPLVKSVTRTDLTIISNQEKQIYLNIEKAAKREQISRQND
jgi:diaminopimelate epimerase